MTVAEARPMKKSPASSCVQVLFIAFLNLENDSTSRCGSLTVELLTHLVFTLDPPVIPDVSGGLVGGTNDSSSKCGGIRASGAGDSSNFDGIYHFFHRKLGKLESCKYLIIGDATLVKLTVIYCYSRRSIDHHSCRVLDHWLVWPL